MLLAFSIAGTSPAIAQQGRATPTSHSTPTAGQKPIASFSCPDQAAEKACKSFVELRQAGDTPHEVKAQAWDAFHETFGTGAGTRLEERLAVLPLPREARANLLDAKVAEVQITARLNRTARTTFAAKAIAAWVAPTMALYLVGWSIGWIRRGFFPADVL